MKLRGVRGRATTSAVLALLVFGIIVGAAAYILVSQLARTSLESSVETRLTEVTELLMSTESASPDLEAIEVTSPVGVQITDDSGKVLEATPGLPSDLRLCDSPTGYLVVTRTVPRPTGSVNVCAGASTAQVERTEQSVLLLLAILLPLVVVGVAVVVWRAVGRALGSVEHLREQAEEIQAVENASMAVQHTGDEVERLGHTLNELLERLHSQSRSTRQFIADAGHELRNPLATLRVALEFDDSPGPGREVALDELNRLELLVQDLLILARSDAQEEPERVPVDLAEIAAASGRSHANVRPEIGIEITSAPCWVAGDPRALRQVADNLIANAVRHARGTVTVSVSEKDDVCTLRVDDDGEGVPADDCARIFERFVRLDEARIRDDGGSGLGLSIVAAHVRAHHGTVVAEPGPGGHLVATFPATDQ